MKWKITYKELSLLLGILVAIVILITVWLKPVSLESGVVSEKAVQQFAKPGVNMLIGKTYVLAKEVLIDIQLLRYLSFASLQ